MSDPDKWERGQNARPFREAAENAPEVEPETEPEVQETEPPEPSNSGLADGPTPPGGTPSNASEKMKDYEREQYFASFEQEDYNRDVSTEFNNSVENDAGDQSL